MSYLGLVVAVIALLSFTSGDVLAKKITTKYGNYLTALFINGFGIIPLFVITIFLPPVSLTPSLIGISILAGFFLVLGSVLAYKSLETEQVAEIWVFLNIPAASIVLFGLLFLTESVTALQIFLVVLVFLGSLMVAINKQFKFNKALLPAFLASLSWTIFILLLLFATSTNGTSGAFFLIARTAGFLMLLAYVIATKKLDKKTRALALRPNLTSFISGIFDGMGQGSYVFLILFAFVAIGGTITAAEPAIVGLLGYMIYKEKLTSWQKTGLLISVAAAMLLGIL